MGCLLLALTATACGAPFASSDRSVKHFCDTYWKQKYTYLHKYSQRNQAIDDSSDQDPFSAMFMGLETTVEAIGDIAVMFDKLDHVSPSDIEPDVAAIRDAFKQAIGTVGGSTTDPLGSFATILISSMSVQGSWDRLGTYVVANCGEH